MERDKLQQTDSRIIIVRSFSLLSFCSRWGGDKSEDVYGQDCKVFAANNVEIVTKTRTEHMSQEDKDRARANKNPLLSFFGPQEPSEDEESQSSVESSTAAPSSSSSSSSR